jgi:hypothetical protein
MDTKPDNWQNLYTVDQSQWNDARRSFWIIFNLLLGVLLSFLFSALFVMVLFSTGQFQSNLKDLMLIFVIEVSPIIIAGIGIAYIFNAALGFFNALYKPPENTNSSKLIRRRLFGVPPVPPPLNAILHYPFVVAVNGEIRKDDEYTKWLGGPASLVILDGTALYLERGSRFSRVVGPGIVFLDKYETIKETVDLRPQTYENKVEAWTKDGIKVEFVAKIICQISDPDQGMASKDLVPVSVKDDGSVSGENTPMYPCPHLSVRKAVEWTKVKRSVNAKDQSEELYQSKWLEGAWGRVQGVLANYVSKRHLEELFVSTSQGFAGKILSTQEREKIRSELDLTLLIDAGVSLLDMQIEKFTIASDVHEKRIEKWMTEWKVKAEIREGKMGAEGDKSIENARAEAQRSLILQIADELSKADPDTLYDSALLTLSRILEQNQGDPYASAYLNDAIEKIKEILKS